MATIQEELAESIAVLKADKCESPGRILECFEMIMYYDQSICNVYLPGLL